MPSPLRRPASGADGGRTVTDDASAMHAGRSREMADEFGVTHRTMRHYEELGLIAPERRGTARVYHRRDRIRLALILRGKRLGFPLEEIRTIIDMYDDHPGEAGQLRYCSPRSTTGAPTWSSAAPTWTYCCASWTTCSAAARRSWPS